jgi:putative DNA-invertase from lambdoid prophage Rac
MKKVYGYIRVSTNNQVENGMSLEDQKRQIELYGEVHKLKVDKVFTERGVSGGVEFYKRPTGKKLMEVLQDGDVIICSKLDRMFRSCLDGLTVLKDLKSRNVELHFIDLGGNTTTNGIGHLMFTIMSSFSEMERNRLGERIRGTKQLKNKEDVWLGGKIPYGYILECHGVNGEKQYLVENKEQQKVIKKMKLLRNEHGLSYRKISDELKKDGVKLSHVGISNILRDEEKKKQKQKRIQKRIKDSKKK